MKAPAESRLGYLAAAARPVRPWLRLSVRSRFWGDVLVAAGARRRAPRPLDPALRRQPSPAADPRLLPERGLSRSDMSQSVATRLAVHALGLAYAQVADLMHEFVRVLVVDNDLDRGFLDHVRDLALALTADLERAGGLDQVIADDLARADHLLQALVRELTRPKLRRPDDLDRARDLVQGLSDLIGQIVTRDLPLAEATIDVSGADLSHLSLGRLESVGGLGSLDALNGVIWDEHTRWPPQVHSVILAISVPIGAGIFQIRIGGEHDRAEPLLV
ncbi:hypothetical protein M2266_006440 [Streptomyces sp. SPB162]|nr:hypothetical protein [Streptomyces sp. SPB162]